MNFYQELGPLVFGTRLKRLSDYFLSEINKVYADQNIPFEASWFGVFFLLDKHESLSIYEIAETLEVSHSAISQLVKNLMERNLLILTPSVDDGRKKDIALSQDGIVLLKIIKPVWQALDQAMTALMDENDVLKNLLKIENGFNELALNERIKSKLNV
ncbi:MarR family transcriptional regulator [Lacihabitans sp. LS3-19]|uniref:MarR family winged helix-turn-helix transcriptional regulator n=1 Tax=Lacihabitans sp. LS3-19 TaxID=2487335 RepID=UPI0020CF792E|nr:helix-turn-helix domain-containing protein [Lacihabitans sp. LS3-19]MCP9768389.1 MarR family transcriptional regulator [Lacihabitans sp. LS3-19]